MDLACFFPPKLLLFFLRQPVPEECLAHLSEAAGVPEVELARYLQLFFLTCLLESPFYLWVFRRKPGRFFPGLLVTNLATHPVVSFAIPWLVAAMGGNIAQSLGVGELFAMTLEGILLRSVWKIPWKWAISIAFAANIFSWWVGLALLR